MVNPEFSIFLQPYIIFLLSNVSYFYSQRVYGVLPDIKITSAFIMRTIYLFHYSVFLYCLLHISFFFNLEKGQLHSTKKKTKR